MASERLTDIESKIAFIEDTMRAIDVRMVEHQHQLDRLEVWCQTLARRMREHNQGGPGSDGHEIPPHY